MTNWPNIQEYRNFEAKFVDGSKPNVLIDSSAESESETVVKDECKLKQDSENPTYVQRIHNSEPKTVRCVIRKDFEETFKKLDRGDGLVSNHEFVRSKTQDVPARGQTAADMIRVQNHLKWKKQKEEEYLQKKEVERLAQQKKREEKLRTERTKKQREKEREEKIREWQEQKAREKEEKRRERMVMKVLEEEIKEFTPTVNKEKLLEEWVKLKNKQRQIEAEKKAEILKKEEENRAVRQNLAEISYRQWKERVKGRMMTLPKNGYQMFGPKPAPVVKEDWNHDFTSASPRDRGIALKGTKSSTIASLTYRQGPKEPEDIPKDALNKGDTLPKSRSPSFCHLKTTRSGVNLYQSLCKGGPKMPLRELQAMTIDWRKGVRLGYGEENEDFLPRDPTKRFSTNSKTFSGENGFLFDLTCLSSSEGDQNRCAVSPPCKKLSGLLNTFPEPQVLPNKKKIDVYINTCTDDLEENRFEKKGTKAGEVKIHRSEKKEKNPEGVARILSREDCRAQNRKMSFGNSRRGTKSVERRLHATRKESAERENHRERGDRRSRSFDKPTKKFPKEKAKGRSASKSMVKMSVPEDGRPAKSRVCSQKRKNRKQSKPNTPEAAKTNKASDSEPKTRKKSKKQTLSKSFSFIDSPYCAKNSKNPNKAKTSRRRSARDGETKSDASARCRRLSATGM